MKKTTKLFLVLIISAFILGSCEMPTNVVSKSVLDSQTLAQPPAGYQVTVVDATEGSYFVEVVDAMEGSYFVEVVDGE
jgi:hypothetical protein